MLQKNRKLVQVILKMLTQPASKHIVVSIWNMKLSLPYCTIWENFEYIYAQHIAQFDFLYAQEVSP